MSSTRNTPNPAAAGPKAGGDKAPAAKKAPAKAARKKVAPAKKAAPAKAAAKRTDPQGQPVTGPTEQVEVRVGNRTVFYGHVHQDSVKVSYDRNTGKLTLAATSADHDNLTPPEPRAHQVATEPPTADEVDDMVANAVPPNQAVVFEQDPRVITTIHDGDTVAEVNDGKRQ